MLTMLQDPQLKRRVVIVAMGAVGLGLLGGGAWYGYVAYGQLTTALHELRGSHTVEGGRIKALTEKEEELAKALTEARARVKTLEEGQKAAEQANQADTAERSKLEAKTAQLATTLQQLQAAHAAAQATAQMLAQKGDELPRVAAELRARIQILEERGKAAAAEQQGLQATNAQLATALQELQTAYAAAAEQTPAQAVSESGEDLAKALTEAQARVKALEERHERLKSWAIKAEQELRMRDDWGSWGKGFFSMLRSIFF
jgi:chromosome segregation ATPase